MCYNYIGVVSWVSVIKRQLYIEKSRWEFESCPLSGIKKCPPLGGYLCISTIVILIRNTAFVRGCPLLGGSVMGGSTVASLLCETIKNYMPHQWCNYTRAGNV